MCVYSMIMDHYHDKWWERTQPLDQPQVQPPVILPMPTPAITPEEIAELRELLRKAKEYDKKNNEPDCELEEKKKKLRELAELLGVSIEFP